MEKAEGTGMLSCSDSSKRSKQKGLALANPLTGSESQIRTGDQRIMIPLL